MKINKLEAHDRLQYLKQDQTVNIFKGAEDCLKKNPLSLALQEKSPYVYLFAHPRTMDSGHKAMYWQPRLSKPSAQTNSYLFRAKSKTDEVEVCWLIPPREQWEAYKRGNVTENELVIWSIAQFQFKRKELENPHPEDMSEGQGKVILMQVINEHKQNIKQRDEMILKAATPTPSEVT